MEKNDAQISCVAVVKKGLSPGKKNFRKKILPAYLYGWAKKRRAEFF